MKFETVSDLENAALADLEPLPWNEFLEIELFNDLSVPNILIGRFGRPHLRNSAENLVGLNVFEGLVGVDGSPDPDAQTQTFDSSQYFLLHGLVRELLQLRIRVDSHEVHCVVVVAVLLL